MNLALNLMQLVIKVDAQFHNHNTASLVHRLSVACNSLFRIVCFNFVDWKKILCYLNLNKMKC
jgi:hypothetical protein